VRLPGVSAERKRDRGGVKAAFASQRVTKDFYELCLEKNLYVTPETIGAVADISEKVHIYRREA
jgi:hypothetical protein